MTSSTENLWRSTSSQDTFIGEFSHSVFEHTCPPCWHASKQWVNPPVCKPAPGEIQHSDLQRSSIFSDYHILESGLHEHTHAHTGKGHDVQLVNSDTARDTNVQHKTRCMLNSTSIQSLLSAWIVEPLSSSRPVRALGSKNRWS